MTSAVQPVIMENPEIAEESVAKKLTSVKTAKPNAQMYISLLIAMVGYDVWA